LDLQGLLLIDKENNALSDKKLLTGDTILKYELWIMNYEFAVASGELQVVNTPICVWNMN
jgi:hypothetical protein